MSRVRSLRMKYFEVFREVDDSLVSFLQQLDCLNEDSRFQELMEWEEVREITLTIQVETINGKGDICNITFPVS